MTKKKATKSTPSLLEPQSSGGHTAQKGFVFQDGVLLSQLPKWLAHEGFSALTRESIGDTEVKFFAPTPGYLINLWEAKDHHLTPSEFWDEIGRFMEIDSGSPGTFRSFTLASVGLSADIQSVVNALRRIRDPYDFYGATSPVIKHSYDDYLENVEKAGKTEREAKFLFDKVVILPNFALGRKNAKALFHQGIADWLPAYHDVTIPQCATIFQALESLVRSRMNAPISRKEIETAIAQVLGRPLPTAPVSICTIGAGDEAKTTDIAFEWADFFGGESRTYLPPSEWNGRLRRELADTRLWIVDQRCGNRIEVSGSRRLSAALAMGSEFSAVSGCAIDLNFRGDTWPTDTHPAQDTPPYEFEDSRTDGKGDRLVVAIGVGRDVFPAVQANLNALGLAGAPTLNLQSSDPIVSPAHTNVAVRHIKDAIAERLTETGATEIQLFFAGPSPLALFLGHRLNATAPVQCYEWTADGSYVPTCRLFG